MTEGITLSSLGAITGFAGLAGGQVGLTASAASTIAAKGGSLVITGAVNDTGNQLTLQITGSTGRLALLNGGSAHTVNFNGMSGKFEIAGNVTIGTAMAIGSGTLQFDNGDLIDASGVTLSTGTLIGGDTVDNITATGAAHFTANFGMQTTARVGPWRSTPPAV